MTSTLSAADTGIRLHALAMAEQGPDGMLSARNQYYRHLVHEATEHYVYTHDDNDADTELLRASAALSEYLASCGSVQEPGPLMVAETKLAALVADTTASYVPAALVALKERVSLAESIEKVSIGHRWEATARYELFCARESLRLYSLRAPQRIGSLGNAGALVYLALCHDLGAEDTTMLLGVVNDTMGTTHTHVDIEMCGDYSGAEAPEECEQYSECVYYTYHNIDNGDRPQEYIAIFYTPQ